MKNLSVQNDMKSKEWLEMVFADKLREFEFLDIMSYSESVCVKGNNKSGNLENWTFFAFCLFCFFRLNNMLEVLFFLLWCRYRTRKFPFVELEV